MKKQMKDLSEKTVPPARGRKTPQADFDRNRDGLYGGLPKARDPAAAGPPAKTPHPASGRAAENRRSR
jgi:hypothetical protein